ANVKKIGTMAFYGCKKLKTVKVQSTSLKKPGKSAFVDISPKAKITLPKKKYSKYKKWFKSAGVKGKKQKFKKK
ncbi:MAG: leucine-rich repeat domain-containing protein, partial [Lachnospiraceae bacterium]|nr:leucine-rich repeat domain-containing protein [Lachnospiraceae bacterium]